MQNGTQKTKYQKITFIFRIRISIPTYCNWLTRSRAFFFPCRVAVKQNEASESGDSVRTLDCTKEALGNAPTIV